jgi:hypothetical protein
MLLALVPAGGGKPGICPIPLWIFATKLKLKKLKDEGNIK